MTRRGFLSASAAAVGTAYGQSDSIPVGIELFSVREGLKKDLMGTVAAVAEMGYKVVEFYAPYFAWTPAYAKQVRKHLDDLGIECRSMHTPARAFEAENRAKAIELNKIVGSRDIVMASPGRRVETADGWKQVADTLTAADEQFRMAGLRAGYHNHASEWRPLTGGGGARHAMDILASGTPESVTLQLDVGTCVEAGADPVAWIRSHPGRIRSIHCKDWAPGEEAQQKGYRVLFGEGVSPWQRIFTAAEDVGGIEFYLIEQEGSRFSEIESARRCLGAWNKMRA